MVIVFGFQILVDGWLTKLSAPIVIYDERHTSGLRFPFDIPVEDFLFGWAMVTAVLLLWERSGCATEGGHIVTVGPASLPRQTCPRRSTSGAPAYDRLVDANPGYHAHLRISAQRMRIARPRPRTAPARRRLRHRRIHRRAAGRGAARPRSWRSTRQTGMLAEAAAKPWPSSVQFVHSRIEDLADAGVDGPFDGILAAYLMRNLTDPDAQLQHVPRAAAARRHTCRARILGARLAAGHGGVERGVRDDHHPERPAAHAATPRCTGICGAA